VAHETAFTFTFKWIGELNSNMINATFDQFRYITTENITTPDCLIKVTSTAKG